MSLILIRKDGLIYAPFDGSPDGPQLLCDHNEHGEAVVPRGPGEDLDMCLYSLRNCSEEAGDLPDGTTVELDGVVLGHFESFHFIPTKPMNTTNKQYDNTTNDYAA